MTQPDNRTSNQQKPPAYRETSVHDPSVVRVGQTFYIFGSHGAAAKSPDALAWERFADGVNERNPLFRDVRAELKETLEWAQTPTLWAPDVIPLDDGTFAMYYCACKGDAPRSALGLATAEKVEGPYRNQGIFLKSGMWGQAGADGAIYDPKIHPNAVDGDAFRDAQGKLWLVYGSYSGGIFILKMDGKTGKPLPGQGWGRRLTGGNHSRIEGPCVLYHTGTRYYYLFLSFGGLDARGGYNLRVARSRNPDGPYTDPAGKPMADCQSDPARPLFDDRSIESYGGTLMANFILAENGVGYVSPGHNSVHRDPRTGQTLLFFHTRFPGRGEQHEVRVHPLYFNAAGWPVVSPLRYDGGNPLKPVGRDALVGAYQIIEHHRKITAETARPRAVRLERDGSVRGEPGGRWEMGKGNAFRVELGKRWYDGVVLQQGEPGGAARVPTFTVLSSEGVAVWGIKSP